MTALHSYLRIMCPQFSQTTATSTLINTHYSLIITKPLQDTHFQSQPSATQGCTSPAAASCETCIACDTHNQPRQLKSDWHPFLPRRFGGASANLIPPFDSDAPKVVRRGRPQGGDKNDHCFPAEPPSLCSFNYWKEPQQERLNHSPRHYLRRGKAEGEGGEGGRGGGG